MARNLYVPQGVPPTHTYFSNHHLQAYIPSSPALLESALDTNALMDRHVTSVMATGYGTCSVGCDPAGAQIVDPVQFSIPI
jgi:hypothetical protein